MSILSLSRRVLGKKDSSGEKKKGAGSGKKSEKKKSATSSKKKKEKVSVVAGRLDAHMIVTEKSLVQQEQETLVVHVKPEASKEEIKQAVREKYGVEPVSIRTVQMRGKMRRRGRTAGMTGPQKKAYVKVADISKLQDVL